MAQTGYTPIALYSSGTASAAPTAGNLVNGELALNYNDGKLFYKDSSGVVQTLATKDTAAGTFTSITDSGNLTFTGTGNRIRGDFSNATVASRVAIQSSTLNSQTAVAVIPNGTNTNTQLQVYTDSAVTNSSFGGFAALGGSEVRLTSGIIGTGTYLPLTMYTGGSERLRIDTSGNVGIGTSSPSTALQLGGATNKTIRLDSATGNAAFFGNFNTYTIVASNRNPNTGVFVDTGKASGSILIDANNGVSNITFNTTTSNNTDPSERMRIDSSGNVGIGTASPATTLNVVKDNTAFRGQLSLQTASASNVAQMTFYNQSTLSAQFYQDYSDNGLNITNTQAAHTALWTNGFERMRIDSSGNLLVGTTSAVGSAQVVASASTQSYALACWNNATSGNNTLVNFGTEGTFTQRGSITYNRGAGQIAYNVTSDYRAKTIDGNIENAINVVDAIKTYKATMNGATISMPMFVAHELAEVAPYCVTGEKDAVDEKENPVYQQVDSTPLIPLLVKAIQEQQVMIEELKAKVAALEATK